MLLEWASIVHLYSALPAHEAKRGSASSGRLNRCAHNVELHSEISTTGIPRLRVDLSGRK